MRKYGDLIHQNGIINYYSKYYDKIIVIVRREHYNFASLLFASNEKVSIRIFVDLYRIVRKNPTIDVFNFHFLNDNEVNGIKEFHKGIYTDPRTDVKPANHYKIEAPNEQFFGSQIYFDVGLPHEYRYKYFDFKRNDELEQKLYDDKIKDEKYNVICEYGDNVINKKYIQNTYPNVNLHRLSQILLDIPKIIENAMEIHLIDNSIALFIYLLQMSGKIELNDKKVYMHIYARVDRGDSEYYYKMFMYPKCDNWIFLHE